MKTLKLNRAPASRLPKAPVMWDSQWMSQTGGNGYEAAKSSPARSNISLTVQNAKKDINKFTRHELLRKARYLYRNSPIIRGLIERLVTYCIGTGLHPTPNTSDTDWNDRALKAWKGWASQPDLESRLPFSVIQTVLFRSMLVDGDIFSLLTFGDSGRPRIQLVESQDITHNNRAKGDDPDGVLLNEISGRPEAYLWKGEERISSDTIVQHYIPERPGQHRGVTLLAAIINTAHDIDDILALEKAGVKEACSKTDVVETASGELPSNDYIGKSYTSSSSSTSDETVDRYYRESFGPEAKVLRKGDKFNQYQNTRPGTAWQGFMEFLSQLICLGAGLPPSLLLGTKVGGADTRRELATAQRVIDMWQQMFSAQLQRIYEYVIQDEIDAGYLPGAPKDWRSVEWQCPAKITVDSGRDQQQDREDVKAGLLSRREYFGRYGQDWKEQLTQCGDEAKFISDLAKNLGVERGEIALIDPNELSSGNNSNKEGDDNA